MNTRRGPYAVGDHAEAPESLSVFCWCGRKVVRVAPAQVRSGLTGTCGISKCHKPAVLTNAARSSAKWDKRAWPTDKQRPGESITAWCRRLDAQEDARAGVKR